MRDRAVISFVTSQRWALHPPVMRELESLLNRHAAGDRTDPRILAAVIEQRDARDAFRRAGLRGQMGPVEDGEESQTAPIQMLGDLAVIEVCGVLSKYAEQINGCSQPKGVCTSDLAESIDAAATSPRVRATLLDIDSPGGTIAGMDDLLAAVSRYRQTGKPLVAFAHDLCASAAYWLAISCDAVLANPGAIVGSVGVYTVIEDTSAAAKAMGIRCILVASGSLKGQGAAGTSVSDAALAEAQEIVNGSASMFLGAVSAARGLSPETAAVVADGGCWLAGEAERMGLIDGIGTFADVVAQMRDRVGAGRGVGTSGAAA